jgi:hypothetical protein
MNRSRWFRLSGVLAAVAVPVLVQADVLPVGGRAATPAVGQDDVNSSSTINATFQTFCAWLLKGLQAGNYSGIAGWTFAGNGSNIGNLFPQIPSTDLSVYNYIPWVVNNNATTNNISAANGAPAYVLAAQRSQPALSNRNITGQDAGGADVIVTYTPRGCTGTETPGQTCDPTTLNFVQSFVENLNGTNPNYLLGTGTIDANSGTPFYNACNGRSGLCPGTGQTPGVSGSGLFLNTIGGSLFARANVPAWLQDIPADFEAYTGAGDCGPRDEHLCSAVLAFQTFVESNQTVYYNKNITSGDPYSLTPNGGVPQTWGVLYGGVQWGYNYSNVDAPEPATFLPLSGILLMLSLCLCRLQREARH